MGATAVGYLAIQIAFLSLTPDGWSKFLVLKGENSIQYWDAIHYFNLGQNPTCSAFYPLWPFLSNKLSGLITGTASLRIQILGSEFIFLTTLPIALLTFRRIIGDRHIALVAFLMYALGANSIFYSIGYTESIFSAISLAYLLAFDRYLNGQRGPIQPLLLSLIFGLSIAGGLTRPSLIQATFACFFAGLGVFASRSTASYRPYKSLQALALTLIGTSIGYAIYGWFCYLKVGNFMGPFKEQVTWGRTLAFRPWLLITPRSLLIDLHGLYLPALLLLFVAAVYIAHKKEQELIIHIPAKWQFYLLLAHPLLFTIATCATNKQNQKARQLKIETTGAIQKLKNPVFLYSLAFSGVHSAINLAANSGYLYSTSRHFFGSPFAFIAIGTVLATLKSRMATRVTVAIAASGAVLLGIQWLNWANDKWVG